MELQFWQNIWGLDLIEYFIFIFKNVIYVLELNKYIHTLSSDNHRSGPGRAPVADQVLCTRRRRGRGQCAVRSDGKFTAEDASLLDFTSRNQDWLLPRRDLHLAEEGLPSGTRKPGRCHSLTRKHLVPLSACTGVARWSRDYPNFRPWVGDRARLLRAFTLPLLPNFSLQKRKEEK